MVALLAITDQLTDRGELELRHRIINVEYCFPRAHRWSRHFDFQAKVSTSRTLQQGLSFLLHISQRKYDI